MLRKLGTYQFFILILSAFVCLPSKIFAQDPQLSQFYSAPLLISPAFAGINNTSKVNFNHRNQWPNLSSSYQFSSLTADINISSINSGIGLVMTTDKQFANLQTTSIGLQYAYHINLAEESSISVGLQSSYVNRGLDYSNLIFGDQFNPSTGSINQNSDDPILKNWEKNGALSRYMDFSTGALLNLRNSWIGISVHHLNSPNQSLSAKNSNILAPVAMKFGIQIGTKILLEDSYFEQNSYRARNSEKSLSPVLNYKHQGTFDQLDLGAYLTISPLVIGAWYRGVPIKKDNDGIMNSRESIVALVGYRQDNFSVGYSYDLTISKLGLPSGGAHEISIAYLFDWDISLKKPYLKIKRTLACPKF
ncbi:PorP/SprF family type IX secretion system membrane protein [Aquirufa rosea]|uniref:Type IX secretion system membrane protein PorP/SprF n=1 Tax=Aquirufa rosea TaxID=2509241 RepID=A0A4Q1BZV0_9BACT|nr:type IX secretion system membrane protein PorP/SprF [Aquirufa rosea]RXK49692.1 type IX secretion system membrane protein PorP/SprF [Aquirufa rosea]